MEKGKKGTKPLNRKSSKISSQNKGAKIKKLFQESKNIYKKLVESSLQGIVIAQGIPPRLIYANPAISRILGYSSDELNSLTSEQIENLLHPDDRLKFFSQYKDLLEGKSIGASYEIRRIRKDGSTVRLGLSATQIEYNGEPAVLATYMDITERKRAEEALRATEERYRVILENIEDGYFEVDIAGNFTFFNDPVCRMLGYSRDEMMGMNNRQFTDPENAIKLYQAFNNVYRTGIPIKGFEWEVIRKDGAKQYSEVSISLIKNTRDQTIGFRGIARDTTERKRMENELQENESRLKIILESVQTGIVIIDPETHLIVEANPVAAKLVGAPKEQIIGSVCHKYICPAEKGQCPITDLGQNVDNSERILLTAEGKKCPIIKTVVPVIIGGRKQLLENFIDITERKKSEETLALSEERYRTLVEESFDGIFIQKGSGIIFANRRLHEMLGYEETELETLDHWVVYHPDYQALTRERAHARMRGEFVPPTYEVKFLRKDGSSFWGEIHAKAISYLGEPGVQVWARDISERKQTEETLRAERERFRSLSENAPFGLAMIDQDGAFKYINSKFKELFGYDLNDVPDGKTWFRKAYPDPDYRHRVISVWLDDLASLKAGEKRPRVFTAKCKDGSEKIVNFIPVQLDSSEILLACEDITERKRAEEALRESEERYRTILENIEDGYYEVDLPGNLTFFNDSLCRMLGYSRDEMIGMGNQQYTDEENRKKLFQAFKEVYKTGEPTKGFDWKVFRKDGKKLFGEVSVSLVKDSKGQPIGFRGIARDITERKQAEEALRRSEESSRELAKENAIMAEIGWIISSTLNIDEVYERFSEEVNKLIPFDRTAINILDPQINAAAVAYVTGVDVPDARKGNVLPLPGSANEEILRTRSSLLLQVENTDDFQHRFPGLLTTYQVGLRSMMSVPLFSKDQIIGVLHIRSLNPNAYSERDLRLAERVGHQIAGAIANAQLFKELMQAEEDKIAIQEQLRQSQKMEAIGGLAGGIAHDFNNLLTVIKGYAEISCLGLDTSDPLRGNIEEILKASERATNLTRQLLAFSRRQILDFKVINLNTLLKDLDKMLHRILGEDIELVYHLAQDIGKVKTDPGQIEQVVLNLAVNARDAMPSGGKLTIETLNVELGEAYAQTHMEVTPGHYVMLSVSDSGAGMAPKVRERIFEPFFTTKEKGKGTGLGLSTVYGIVKQSGGNINVYSEPGFGTTFKIYLPRVEEEEDILQRKDPNISLSTGNETILLAEDEPSVRELAVRILRDRGYQVYDAHDGKDALNMVQGHPERKIHLLLTDVVMPGMSGKELADRLKLSMPDIKVLFISGYTDNAIVHHGVLLEGVEFLQKPFTYEALARKVREVLDR